MVRKFLKKNVCNNAKKIFFLFFLLFCICFNNFVVAKELPRILIINSYHFGYGFSDEETKGVIEDLHDAFPGIEPYVEFLDSKNFPDMEHLEYLKDIFKNKYSNKKISLIIVEDDPAFIFIKKYRDELFGSVPVVFCGVNNFKPEMIKGIKSITGVSEGMDVAENIVEMLKQNPDAKEIVMLHDYTVTGLATRDEVLEKLKNIKTDVKISFWPDMSFDTLLKDVRKLNEGTLVFILGYNRDKNGQFLNYDYLSKMLGKESNVPVYGTREAMFGYGIVGGSIMLGKVHAAYAAKMAIDILNGKPIESIPVYTGSTSRFMYDYNQLKKYNIKLSLLPAESIIINKPVYLFEKYMGYIWGTILVFFFLLAIIIIMAINIKRRQLAERNLIKTKQHLQIALQSTKSYYFEDNFITGEIICSPEMFIKLGYSEAEAPRTMSELMRLVHPDDAKTTLDAIDKHSRGEKDSYYAEFRIKAKDGNWVWYSGAGKITEFGIDGSPMKLTGLSSEITESKKNQEKLILYANELKEMNASKDKFFSIIAHDLKSPFLGLLGFSSVLSKNINDLSDEEIQKYATYINKATKSVYELIEHLLEWSRLQTGRMEFSPKIIDLQFICDNIFELMIGASKNKNIKLVNEVPPFTKVRADENMIRTVLHNLISNAIKFTNNEGTIIVKYLKLENFTEVSVIDNGVGIKNKDFNKLFKLDETISNKGTNGEEGTGLGLILCKEMISKHNGEIFAESEPGRGSKFTFRLPNK